uniref:Calponin-homology (CH) domain-containing protein n=1 Tax=Ailuropoda melanoleuca TaxID=9646 RepID=A0A7N5KL77_AILME
MCLHSWLLILVKRLWANGISLFSVERENVQKRTFTRWVNLHLEKCDPPLEVKDLFVDIQDGKILMALLEVLSGRNLVRMSHKGQGDVSWSSLSPSWSRASQPQHC